MKKINKIKKIVSLGLNFFNGEFDGDFLLKNNIDCVRLNFSHLDHSKAEKTLGYFREKYPDVKIMQDIQGQKWRVHSEYSLKDKLVSKNEQMFFCDHATFLSKSEMEKENYIPIQMEGDFSILKQADIISMKDGSVEFDVIDNQADKGWILTRAKDRIMIRREKSINIPLAAREKLSVLTEKDKQDIEWGIKNKVDIICLSFVNKKEDIDEFKKIIGKNKLKIWAKIETVAGCKNFISILENVNGVVLGRGDLIPELGRFESTVMQYQLLEQFVKHKKNNQDFIVATHIFNSLMAQFDSNPAITDLNDIYQSVRNGATGFMLTNEVGYGKQSKKAIATLNQYLNFLNTKI